MINIRNKRLMNYNGMEEILPSANDFTFFGGGGKGGKGGGTTVVYVPQVQKETIEKVKPAPNPAEQATAPVEDVSDVDGGDGVGGRKRTLGGTRKLAIPVTASR